MWSLGKVIDTPEVARVYVGVLPALSINTATVFGCFGGSVVLKSLRYTVKVGFNQGSFWDQPLKNEKLRELFEQEAGPKTQMQIRRANEETLSELQNDSYDSSGNRSLLQNCAVAT